MGVAGVIAHSQALHGVSAGVGVGRRCCGVVRDAGRECCGRRHEQQCVRVRRGAYPIICRSYPPRTGRAAPRAEEKMMMAAACAMRVRAGPESDTAGRASEGPPRIAHNPGDRVGEHPLVSPHHHALCVGDVTPGHFLSLGGIPRRNGWLHVKERLKVSLFTCSPGLQRASGAEKTAQLSAILQASSEYVSR